MFGALVDLTGVRTSAFMLLYGTVCVSLVWMHYSFKGHGQAARPVLQAVPA
jgi:NNP family nitrate/nitrite transporter-like MFS transporter